MVYSMLLSFTQVPQRFTSLSQKEEHKQLTDQLMFNLIPEGIPHSEPNPYEPNAAASPMFNLISAGLPPPPRLQVRTVLSAATERM